MSKSLKSRPSLGEIFPWWDLAFTTVLVVVMALVLGAHSMKLDEAYVAVRAQSSQHKCLASANLDGLQKEKKGLEGKIDAVRKFLDSRILWSAYTRDLSIRLPPNVVLNSWEGKSPLAGSGRNAAKRAFSLRARAPLAQDGVTPRDIDAFLGALRNHPALQARFRVGRTRGDHAIPGLRQGCAVGLVHHRLRAQWRGPFARRQVGGKMTPTDSGDRRASLKAGLLERLHDPLQLRICVIAVVLLVGYGAVYQPLSDKIDETKRKLDRDKKLLDLAGSIEQLQEQYRSFEGRLPQQVDTKEWVQYVLEGIRRLPLKMSEIRLSPTATNRPLSGRRAADRVGGVVLRSRQVSAVVGVEPATAPRR